MIKKHLHRLYDTIASRRYIEVEKLILTECNRSDPKGFHVQYDDIFSGVKPLGSQ